MAGLQLFFFNRDGHGVTTDVFHSTGKFSLESDISAVRAWWQRGKAKAADAYGATHFAGIYSDLGGKVWPAPKLITLLKSYREGLSSVFARRYAHVEEIKGKRRLVALSATEQELDDQGVSLWYEAEDAIPLGAEDDFCAYTLIYWDCEESAVITASVQLNKQFDAAITRLLMDEPFGAWEPIALIEGEVEPVVHAHEVERDHVEFRHKGGKPEPSRPGAVVELPKATPALRVPASQALAEILTRAGVASMRLDENQDLAEFFHDGHNSFQAFIEIVRQRRPLIVIETQYWEIADVVARFLAAALKFEFTHASAYHDIYRSGPSEKGRIVFYDDALFNTGHDLDRSSVRTLLKDLVTSRDVGLVVVGNKRAIPLAFQNYTDFELQLPAIVGPVREQVFEAILGSEVAKDSEADKWSRYLLPFDFEKVIATGLVGTAAVTELKARVDRRLARKAAVNAPGLSEIHGLGEAKEVALQLVEDIRLAVTGEVDWSEVDRGMLLIGAPGTGKTMLAKAISKESGIRFIAGSALEWQSSGALDQHLSSIREFFAEARRYAPTIVFIDEFDAIGNRQHHQGRNDYYTTAVVNCVLEELQGFHDREGVVVIGATNEPDKIDPALKRAGRLDQQITINRPNVHELALIYGYHINLLRLKDQVEDPIDTDELARLSFGQTGADVEFYVRGGRRRGRKARRLARQADFVAEIMRRPIGPSGLERMSEEEIYRTAVHEAGHALAQLVGPSKGKDISYVSIIPRPDGTLGFVASFHERVDIEREEVMELLRVFLAGRAAEEVIFGRRSIGAGSGGGSLSDLGQATRLVTRMFLQYGYSQASGLYWRNADTLEANSRELPRALRREAQRTLDLAYGEVVARLKRNKGLLVEVANTLMQRQEMTGAELRNMVSGLKLSPAGLFPLMRRSHGNR